MRSLFIGGTKRGYLTLKTLLGQRSDIAGIISLEQDAHEVERFEEPMRGLARKFNIPCYQTKWMKDRDYVRIISEEINPEIAFVVGCRILIPKEIWDISRLGTLAVHDSLLPEYRGFAPLNWAIINGETQTGVTLFYLSELMDGGDIVGQRIVSIGPDDTAPLVYERVCSATIELILEMYPLLEQGKAPRIKQNYSVGSFACSRTPADGMIDWSRPTSVIYNQIRALTFPYPGAYTFYRGKKLIIWTAKPVNDPPSYRGRIPGRVVAVSKTEGSVDVLTGDGVLRIFEVQIERDSRLKAAEVIDSIRTSLGLNYRELLNRIERLETQIHEVDDTSNERISQSR